MSSNNKTFLTYLAIFLFQFCNLAFAGGLEAGNEIGNTTKTYLYGLLGIGALIYVVWCIINALLQRGSWSDVIMSFLYCGIAGGCLVLAQFIYGKFQ